MDARREEEDGDAAAREGSDGHDEEDGKEAGQEAERPARVSKEEEEAEPCEEWGKDEDEVGGEEA